MNEEQRQGLIQTIDALKKNIDEIERMIGDYDKCESEISRKYLGAAIMKMSSALKQDNAVKNQDVAG